MTDRPVRFAGEYHGPSPRCEKHGTFAFGFADDREPRAMTFEGPDCTEVAIRNVQLIRQVDDDLWVSLEFQCLGCGSWNAVKTDCHTEPGPGSKP